MLQSTRYIVEAGVKVEAKVKYDRSQPTHLTSVVSFTNPDWKGVSELSHGILCLPILHKYLQDIAGFSGSMIHNKTWLWHKFSSVMHFEECYLQTNQNCENKSRAGLIWLIPNDWPEWNNVLTHFSLRNQLSVLESYCAHLACNQNN